MAPRFGKIRAPNQQYQLVTWAIPPFTVQVGLGGVAAFVRLAGDRPDHAGQSRRRRARAAPYRAARQDAGARPAGSAADHRRDRRHDRHRPTRSGAHRPHGLFFLPHRRGDRHAGRGCVFTEPAAWVRLHEKGGKQHAMPCHHNLETYLHEYIDGAGWRPSRRRCCFRATAGRPASSPATPCPKPT